MKHLSTLTLGALALTSLASSAEAFEMRRIAVDEHGAVVRRCIVATHAVTHEYVVNGVKTDVHSGLTADEATITGLIEQVPDGFKAPESEKTAKTYTNWWVKLDGERNFRLVRSNVDGQVYQEPSEASQKLARILGVTCGI
jgi:hypothetical protein